jgi:hypothetical protein
MRRAPARGSRNQEVGTRPPARKRERLSCAPTDSLVVPRRYGSGEMPSHLPNSPRRVFRLPLTGLGKSVGQAPEHAQSDRRITVDGQAYPHGESAECAGPAMPMRLARSGDDHDRSTDRANPGIGITVTGQEKPHRGLTDCA